MTTPRIYLTATRTGMSTRYEQCGPEDMGAEAWIREPFNRSESLQWIIENTTQVRIRDLAIDILTDERKAEAWVPEGSGVRVKALEWNDAALVDANDLIIRISDTAVGKYTIRQDGAWFALRHNGVRFGGTIPTLEAAKAAAQADYEARILAALEPVAQPEPTPGQFETMCLAIEDVISGRGFDVDPWQPIETAPKDGREFQAWVEWRGRGIWEPRCRYDEWGAFQVWQRVDYDQEDWDCDTYASPTHWMPQPGPPGETTSAIPEAVKAYLRNAMMVGGWRGERDV